ncbi:MAG: AI-2E family transporter, partial [Deltaproteobacteria bacterium]|nr:AI-2E family transporter [Deltaproteobacteria bacterium]
MSKDKRAPGEDLNPPSQPAPHDPPQKVPAASRPIAADTNPEAKADTDAPTSPPDDAPTSPPDTNAETKAAAIDEADWWGLFHIHAFVALTEADRHIERRELVWIRRFLHHQDLEHLEGKLDALLASGPQPDLRDTLVDLAAQRLTKPDKRRFVYNLAQLCKSKGSISDAEYENVLDLGLRLGIAETEADSIINSVFSINDSFMAIVGILALGFILYAMRTVIVPLVIALFITMIINKVEELVSRGLHLHGRLRWFNKLVAMVVILGVLFGLVMAAVSSGKDISDRAPYYQLKIAKSVERAQVWAKANSIPWPDNTEIAEGLQKLPIGQTLSGFFSSLFTFLGNFFLVVIFVGFLVFSSMDYKGILQEMNDKISAYISIKAMIGVVTGIGVATLCWVFGIDFPLFWAILAFLLNFIPSVGSIIASLP